MRILVTGIHGQVGFELLRSLDPLGEIIPADRAVMDFCNPDAIRAYVDKARPDLIVNPAAYTAVDRAEQEPELCMAVNTTAVGVLAEEAQRIGAAMIHYSTDYVFDGRQPAPYREDDPPCPLNVYGASKLAGEKALAAACREHLILRTSWVYGMRGSNFLLTMLRLSQQRDSLGIVADQIGAPTWSRTIADRTAALVARYVVRAADRTVLRCPAGPLNLAAAGQTSWAGFAREIFRLAGRGARVEDIPATEYPTAAARPANSLLDTTRLTTLLGAPMEPWQTSLAQCLRGEVQASQT